MIKWIEMIRVRSMRETLEEAMQSLEEQLLQISRTAGMVEAVLLKHALYDGDLAAILVWNPTREPGKTREGLLLAEQMQRLGTVDYAVWEMAPGTSVFQDGRKLSEAEVAEGDCRCQG